MYGGCVFNFRTFWLSAYHLTCVSKEVQAAQLEPTVWTHMPRSSHCIIYPRHPSNFCDALESSVLFSLRWHTWKLNTPESFAVALYYCCTSTMESTCWFWVYLASRFNIHARFLMFPVRMISIAPHTFHSITFHDHIGCELMQAHCWPFGCIITFCAKTPHTNTKKKKIPKKIKNTRQKYKKHRTIL